MSKEWNLDLPTETTTYIPYVESDLDDQEYVAWATSPEYAQRDLQDGPQLRLAAYKKAWESCLKRMKDIVRELHAAIITKAVLAVEQTYREQQPLMPYTELPVIAISGMDRSAMSVVFANIFEQLDKGSEDNELEGDGDISLSAEESVDKEAKIAYIASLSPADCVNLQQTMKALITSFVDQSAARSSLNASKPATSLAVYDINLLHAWFNTIKMARGEDDLPRLVVLLQDFEQWETSLVGDLFYICSLHIPRLPLVFMLATSSPLSSYIHTTYSRSTLALLEIMILSMPSGAETLDTLLLEVASTQTSQFFRANNEIIKTFFDASYTPDVLIGPAVIDFITDQITLHTFSIDFVFSILQLLYMRHFMEPLTVFAVDDLLGTPTRQESLNRLRLPSATAFVNSLALRLNRPNKNYNTNNNGEEIDELNYFIDNEQSALFAIATARDLIRTHAKRRSLGFEAFRLVQAFLLRQGYKTVESGQTHFEIMSACLRGTLGRKEGKYLATMVKKLSTMKLSDLLIELHLFFNDQSAGSRSPESEMRLRIITAMSQIPEIDQQDYDSTHVAKDVGEWLHEYFVECMKSYTNTDLWDLWYIGQASWLSELMNPSPRMTLKEGLLHPERYLPQDFSTTSEEDLIFQIPNITIAFQRYLESGKMINIYDWYESFAVTLNAGRQAEIQKKQMDIDRSPDEVETARKSRRKSKGKPKANEQEKNGLDKVAETSLNVEDNEEWKREVLARFVRCVHELDYMGFIKHTNRKADHAIKTFFDPPDYDEEFI